MNELIIGGQLVTPDAKGRYPVKTKWVWDFDLSGLSAGTILTIEREKSVTALKNPVWVIQVEILRHNRVAASVVYSTHLCGRSGFISIDLLSQRAITDPDTYMTFAERFFREKAAGNPDFRFHFAGYCGDVQVLFFTTKVSAVTFRAVSREVRSEVREILQPLEDLRQYFLTHP